jgi:hypothetical protein
VRSSFVALFLAGLSACAEVGPVTAEADDRLPNVIHLTWNLLAPAGEHWAEYGLDGAFDQRSPTEPTGNTTTLVGLKSGRDYAFRVVVETPGGARVVSDESTFSVEAASSALPSFTVGEDDRDAQEPGGLVLTSLLQDGDAWVVVLDRDGDYVWAVQADENINIPGVRLDSAGTGVLYTQNARKGSGNEAVSGIVHQPFDGSPRTLTATDDAHHDALQLPDGRIAFLREYTEPDVQIEDGSTVNLGVDALALAPEGLLTPRDADTIFDFKAHYPEAPWEVCQHFADPAMGGGKDWVHANSLLYEPDNSVILVNSRNFDAMVALNPETGSPLWQLGGRYGDFADLDGDTIGTGADAWQVEGPNRTWWSHGHLSHFWADGFVIFDNGYHHTPTTSRVVEYALDIPGRTVRKVWEFESETAEFDPLLGDVRKLDNGNYLVSWTLQGMLTEITPAGTVVWRASSSIGNATTRVRWLPDLYGDRD